ncbi:hypothetical protein CRM22_007842 [Opisthorchis felineus]|uniref:Uncharacterized protein n=1 Tax=Opisthorchis felineus TaxID=147828 RepID=A0A4S2LG45_OPIFE|nr:hypothetical protein CRM22_007842 [Opisthorchis felineus]
MHFLTGILMGLLCNRHRSFNKGTEPLSATSFGKAPEALPQNKKIDEKKALCSIRNNFPVAFSRLMIWSPCCAFGGWFVRRLHRHVISQSCVFLLLHSSSA